MPSRKTIQEQFGQAVIDQLRMFARAEIKGVADLESTEFDYVADKDLRGAIARTMYGARWIYKVGLALVVDGDESIAHVRTQVIDYGSVCESLLKYTVGLGVTRGLLAGHAWKRKGGRELNWTASARAETLKNCTFKWLVDVAREERIVSTDLSRRLHRLREQRNTVHITQLAAEQTEYARSLAKEALGVVNLTTRATKHWIASRP